MQTKTKADTIVQAVFSIMGFIFLIAEEAVKMVNRDFDEYRLRYMDKFSTKMACTKPLIERSAPIQRNCRRYPPTASRTNNHHFIAVVVAVDDPAAILAGNSYLMNNTRYPTWGLTSIFKGVKAVPIPSTSATTEVAILRTGCKPWPASQRILLYRLGLRQLQGFQQLPALQWRDRKRNWKMVLRLKVWLILEMLDGFDLVSILGFFPAFQNSLPHQLCS